MKMTVIGKEKVDYVSRKSNQQVTGVTLHVTQETEKVEGLAVDTVFVSSKSNVFGDASAVKLGEKINVFYNRYGAIDTIALCK